MANPPSTRKITDVLKDDLKSIQNELEQISTGHRTTDLICLRVAIDDLTSRLNLIMMMVQKLEEMKNSDEQVIDTFE